MSVPCIYTHPDCRLHDMGAGSPECPARLDAITDHLLATGLDIALERRDAPEARSTRSTGARPHARVTPCADSAPCWPKSLHDAGRARAIDPDTIAMPAHLDATLRAAGAAMAATDDGAGRARWKTAFCSRAPARGPPRHAPTRRWGSAFFNNVAIAARHALERHGLARVAIVDFDVHHGNGTENILTGDARVLMSASSSIRSTPTAAPCPGAPTWSTCRAAPTPAAPPSARPSTRTGCRAGCLRGPR